MKYFNLKFLTFFLTALLAFGVGWADEVVAYTLTPTSGTNNSYTGNCDIEIDGITWNLTGNSQQSPWRIGGKSISNVDRTLYSKTSISENVSKIEVKHGAASSITVNSWTVIVSKNSDFSNPVSSLTPTFSANSTTTITRPDGADWSNCYFKFVYNVTVSGSSNKFLEFTEAKFYDLSGGSVTPTCAKPTFSLAEGSYYGTQSVSLSCETEDATIYYTTDGSAPDENSDVYSSAINVDKTMTIKAIAMKDGMEPSSIASAEYIIKDPSEAKLYTNVTDLSQLKVGYKYILVNEQKKAFCGAIGKDGNNYGLAVTGPNIETTTDGKKVVKVVDISNTEGILEMTLGGNSNGWTFDTGNGYLNYDGKGNNSLHISNDATIAGSKWTAADTEFGFVSLQNVGTTDRYIRFNSSSPRFACYTSAQSNAILYVEVKEETPTDDPTIEVDPTRLTINDKDENNTFTVTGSNLIDNIGVTPSAGFETIPDPKPSENETWGFVNNGGSVNGTVTVNYTGTELSTTGTVSMGTKPYVGATDAEDVTKVVNVTYLSDVYILGNYGDGWNFNDGSHKMSYNEAEGTYTAEYDIPANSYIVFARKLSENALWNDGRSYFGPKNDDDNDDLEMDVDNKSGELNMSANTVIHITQAGFYQFTINASGKTFTITRTLPQVEKPKITPNGGNFAASQTVTITTTTDGASIYYTTDESEPSAENGTLYEGELTLSANTTLKAIAVKDGMRPSEVASATFTKTGIDDLAGVIALGGGKNFTFVGNVVVTFKGTYGNHTLVGLRDVSQNNANGHGGGVFHNTATDLTVGQVLQPGWTGKTNVYNGLTQIENASGIVLADQTAEVLPFERSGFEFTAENLNEHISEYLILRNITISNGGTKATWTDDSKKTVEYNLYNRFNVDYGDGNYKSLTGVLNVFNNTIQIYPLELEKAQVEAGLTYGEEPVAVTAKIGEDVKEPELTNPNNLTVTYSSSDTNVATVDAEGNVTAVGAGEATITASFAGNDNYLAGEASYTITVTKKDAGLKYEQAELTVYAGNDFTAPTLVNPNKLSPITYSIEGNDPEIVLFDEEDGTVVVGNKTGTVTITATFAGNDTYNEATASYTLNIIKKEVATLSFGETTSFTVYPDADFTAPTLTTTPEGLAPITYSSDNENVAMVDDKTGEVVIGDKTGKATITATFAGNDTYGTATASYTVTVEPRPIVVADKGVEFELYVGQTETKTFDVTGENLKGDITLTLNDETGFYRIEPTTIDMDDAENATVTVTYAPTTEGFHEATVTLSTKDAEEDATVTLTGMAEVQPVVAMPTFSLVAGSYTGAQQVIINCATEGATISYSIDGGSTWTVGNTVNVDKDMTIMAKAEMEGMSESAVATGYYVIDIPEALPTDMPTFDGYYSVLNSGKYANIQGRKTLTFTDAPDAQAGTVIRLKSDNTGKVEVLRSQAADLQRYAYRAMDYVPDIVQIVVDKLGAEGEDHILGKDGLDAIMTKFDESFKPDLYIEKAGDNGYRIYGRTPSMQPVVDFYRENKDKVEAKLPDLVAFINSALAKLRNKANQAGMDGDNVFVDFDLKTIWTRMGGNLTDPEVDEMGFYRDVLNYKDNVWNFAYQTATFYLEKIKNTGTYTSLSEQLGEFAQYLDKIDQIHPDFKYYIVANEEVTKPDFISQGNADIINNAARTIWTIKERPNFTVNFPKDNKHNGEYVTTLYTDFAYTLPEGVTAWAVTSVSDQGIGELTAIDGTTIAAQTPVLLKSTTAGDVATFGITTADGTAAPEGNLLVGPDYLIETYQIKTPEVVKMFEAIKTVLGENIYNDLVDKYGHLQFRTSGTVNNKYFWGLNEEEVKSCAEENPETGKKVKVVRSLGIKDYLLGFNDNEHVYTNKALLVSTEHSAINFSLRGDINKDGVISIIDVTALIDILLDLPARNYLEPTTSYPKGLDYEAADVNENKDIEITDVTTLIDILLNMPDQPAQGSGN